MSRSRWLVGLLVVSAVATTSSLTLARSANAHHRPRLSERRLVAIALTAAARGGDPEPTLVQHSAGTRHAANLVDSGDIVAGRAWSYLIAIRGRFVLNDAKILAGT